MQERAGKRWLETARERARETEREQDRRKGPGGHVLSLPPRDEYGRAWCGHGYYCYSCYSCDSCFYCYHCSCALRRALTRFSSHGLGREQGPFAPMRDGYSSLVTWADKVVEAVLPVRGRAAEKYYSSPRRKASTAGVLVKTVSRSTLAVGRTAGSPPPLQRLRIGLHLCCQCVCGCVWLQGRPPGARCTRPWAYHRHQTCVLGKRLLTIA